MGRKGGERRYYKLTVPPDRARRDEPNLKRAVLAGGGHLSVIGAGGKGHHGRGLPLRAPHAVNLQLLHHTAERERERKSFVRVTGRKTEQKQERSTPQGGRRGD